jgi:hypothetical protein
MKHCDKIQNEGSRTCFGSNKKTRPTQKQQGRRAMDGLIGKQDGKIRMSLSMGRDVLTAQRASAWTAAGDIAIAAQKMHTEAIPLSETKACCCVNPWMLRKKQDWSSITMCSNEAARNRSEPHHVTCNASGSVVGDAVTFGLHTVSLFQTGIFRI